MSLSGCPCGNEANCDTLAETNKLAEAFLQAATHAPHPIHAAASNAYKASSCEIGIALPSGALPVFTDIYPPDCIILSNGVLSTTKSLITGKGFALHGSITILSPSLK